MTPLDTRAVLVEMLSLNQNPAERAALSDALSALNYRESFERARHSLSDPVSGVRMRQGLDWTDDDDGSLRQGAYAGLSLDTLARLLERQSVEVVQRLVEPHRLLSPSAGQELCSLHDWGFDDIVEPLSLSPVVELEDPEMIGPEPTTVLAQKEATASEISPKPLPARPEMTAEAAALVEGILSRYRAPTGPRGTLRTYVNSPKFTSKLSPAALAWLQGCLTQLDATPHS